MATRRVYYFCEQVFASRGYGRAELVCTRMMENDPRISEWTRDWQKRGPILYLPAEFANTDSEIPFLHSKVHYERLGPLVVKDAPSLK